MRQIVLAAFSSATLILAGCATTGSDTAPAPVDTPGGKPPPSQVQTQPVKPVDVTGKPGALTPQQLSALKDPKNILSKRSIFYDLDKFDVKDEYRSLVEAHAKYLRENPNARMLIQGNTDERGSREYNVGLGQRRSDGVKRMMTLLGARENQVETVSLGEEKPQDPGQSEAAYSKNRRSDILYSGEY